MASAFPKDVATPKMPMIHSCQIWARIGESGTKQLGTLRCKTEEGLALLLIDDLHLHTSAPVWQQSLDQGFTQSPGELLGLPVQAKVQYF